uniref:GST N-terminal domain-containing protein n=1 Tax=Lotharella oceanica TaxID=641309 RepID=A0A7S2U3I9_9EUKA|mmetsp:Transcript_6871/g.13614  ORF Transcript_6871/g.13614 Transcript_6871/m.13614 type:complete len:342 (+) Transcript_6871:40-1065(+)
MESIFENLVAKVLGAGVVGLAGMKLALYLLTVKRSAPTGGIHSEITIPSTDEWELYHNSFSTCSKRLRLCLAELKVPYKGHHIHLIETGAYESCSPAFLEINPGGIVPVLVHDGHPVYESEDQIIYLAKHSGDAGKRLLGSSTGDEKLVREWVSYASIVDIHETKKLAGNCIPGLSLPLFAAMVQYVPTCEILKGLLTHPHKERPLVFLLMRALGPRWVMQIPIFYSGMRKAREDLKGHLASLERQLASHGRPWITGDVFTLADVSWIVLLDRLREANWLEYYLGSNKYPFLKIYWERAQLRTSCRSQLAKVRCRVAQAGMNDLGRQKKDYPRLLELLEGT